MEVLDTLCVCGRLTQIPFGSLKLHTALSSPCPMTYIPLWSQCVELFASMVEKVHSVEPLQYVLTLLADLTDDEKNVTLIVKTTDGWVY